MTSTERSRNKRDRDREAAKLDQAGMAADPQLALQQIESDAAAARARESAGCHARAAAAISDPAGLVAEWSREALIVPPGHPAEGEPMALPDYGLRFLRDALAPGVRESLLCMARKNAKSAICAVLLLSYLVGPLRENGWRAAVVSVDKSKAYELVRQARDIAASSRLAGLQFLRSPAPGRIETTSVGPTCDILAASDHAGHSAGYDLVLVDETGLLQERHRALLSGLRSSTSARNGRVAHISIRGDGPFIPELIERKDDPSVCVHAYLPDPGSDPTDEATWEASNPGLTGPIPSAGGNGLGGKASMRPGAGIKQRSYMVDRARIAAQHPGDLALFAAEDCNLPGSPVREMVCSVADWSLLGSDPSPRQGRCVVGFDCGGSTSMTAAAVIWPETGRLEVYAGLPVTADYTLIDRGRADQVGSRYQQLADGDELWTYEGRRTTPAADFLADLAAAIEGETVSRCGADRYRRAEVVDFMSEADLRWPMVWRGQGAASGADGSADVRAFQRAVLGAAGPDQQRRREGWLRPARGHKLMIHAISESAVRRDPAGNPALEKGRSRGRIDPLSAAVIACGLAERERAQPRVRYRSRSFML